MSLADIGGYKKVGIARLHIILCEAKPKGLTVSTMV